MIDSAIKNANIIVRSLATEVVRVVNKNTWKVEKISPKESSGGGDDFRPEPGTIRATASKQRLTIVKSNSRNSGLHRRTCYEVGGG